MSAVTDPAALRSLRNLTWAVYALYAASALVGVTAIAAIIVNYVKRSAVVGTLYGSHFEWQIRTFWIGLAGMVAAVLTTGILVGYAIGLVTLMWSVYRLVIGALRLMDGRPVSEGRYGMAV
jgi:uncharacterized membrane protein